MSLSPPTVRPIDGTLFRLGIVASRFNEELVAALLSRLVMRLRDAGVGAYNLTLLRVPGSHEVPWAAGRLAVTGNFDCVVALGVLIGGDTNHHEMVGQSVSHALQRVALDTGVPVINGVIVTANAAQARARCTGRINRGAEFAQAALEMASLKRSLASPQAARRRKGGKS